MQNNNHKKWEHKHKYHRADDSGERNVRKVIILTVVMMVVEVAGGFAFGSMALLADGWHMGTHAIALGITAFAYYYARRHADNPKYSFGTGKVGVLGGYTSAIVLAIVALVMVVESIKRLISPVDIKFNEAIAVAFIGLIVNLISAFLLQGSHSHDSGHGSEKSKDHERHHHHDYNLKAAYFHVMADALTSLLAIIALITGKTLGWKWMDPMMGIVGAFLILRWARSLLKDTSSILLDAGIDQQTRNAIVDKIQSEEGNEVADIHVWPLGSDRYSAIISIVTHFPESPEYYKALLKDFKDLYHLTVEVNRCEDQACLRSESMGE